MTKEDIKRRKQLSTAALKKLKIIWKGDDQIKRDKSKTLQGTS